MTNIPEWLTSDEEYMPKKDSSTFIDKTSKSMLKTLSSIKRNNTATKAKEANTSIRLLSLLILIILTSVSRNFSFVFLMIAITVIRVALMQSEKIKSWIKTILPVIIFSALILFPAIFLGNPKTPLTILGKIFVSVSMVLVFNLTTNFNNTTRALRLFRIPSIMIFTFDLAIKYIFILGETCFDMLKALKIRSIGKNADKKGSASGILGTVFIKAKNSADLTAKAMECRGFNGEYVVAKEKFKLNKNDFFELLLFAICVGAFIYLEVLI